MIKTIINIYPNETFYSYLSRLFCHSGYGIYRSFAKEVFKKELEYPEFNFINELNEDFKKLLETNINFKSLILNHTLFKYYAVFLNNDKKLEALNYAMSNKTGLKKYLPIPNIMNNYKLRYCPICAKEDRKKYGECYYHVEHQVYDTHICAKHKCELIDTNIENTKLKDSTLTPLELVVDYDKDTKYYDDMDINLIVARYITAIFKQDLNYKNDSEIGTYLTSLLNPKYLSKRGQTKKLELILNDMNELYINLIHYDINKGRIDNIFRNKYINSYDIMLIALFENIKVRDIVSRDSIKGLKHIEFDNKVKKMYSEGMSYLRISKILKCNKETVRKVILGVYSKK